MTNSALEGTGFEVTSEMLRTPRRFYRLQNIEHIAVKQPLLIICGMLGSSMALTAISFMRYLYLHELIFLIGGSAIAILLAARVGSLKVHSLALRDDEGTLFGDIKTLRAVKEAVEVATKGTTPKDTQVD